MLFAGPCEFSISCQTCFHMLHQWDQNISFFTDKIGIDALLNHFDVTEHIEAKLNREDSFLQNWRQLAELYKQDGLINDEDIPSLEPKKDPRSPTAGLMLHALKRDSASVKVEDLVVYLAKMRRTDCLNVVARYLKGRSVLIIPSCRIIRHRKPSRCIYCVFPIFPKRWMERY